MKVIGMDKKIIDRAQEVSLGVAFVVLLTVIGFADEVVLKSGIKIQGSIESADSTKVVVVTPSGKRMTYARADVAQMKSQQSELVERADNLLKAGKISQAQKELTAIVESGGLFKSDAQIKLMQCLFLSGQWEKGVALYLSVLNADPGTTIAANFPWQGIGAEQADAILKGIAGAGELSGPAAAVADVFKTWAKCAKDSAADVKTALGGALASKEAAVSDTAAVAQMHLLFQRKDCDGCQAFIQKLFSKLDATSQAWGRYWQGRCLLEKGDLERAALAFLRVGWTSADLPALAGDSLFMAATCFEKKRQSDRAAELYNEIAQEYPLALCIAEARKKAKGQ
jgi:TolA-binding protein